MEAVEVSSPGHRRAAEGQPSAANGQPTPPRPRACLDGKRLARGGRRLRVQGVTYGPFTANAAGEPFPTPARVREDFAAMRAAAINAVRAYHVPPDWLLHLADEH